MPFKQYRFVVSLSLSIFFNYGENIWGILKDWETANSLIFDILFGNNVQLSSATSVYLQTAMCVIISLSTISIILSLLSSMKNLHSKTLPYKGGNIAEYNCEWLNSHTLYFHGLLKHDGQGKLFESILSEFVEEYGGRIIKAENTIREPTDESLLTHPREEHKGIFVVKNYRKFNKLQEKREGVKDLLEFRGDREPYFRRICVRK